MATGIVNMQDPDSWIKYVRTAQAEAGEGLELPGRDDTVFHNIRENPSDCRPIFIFQQRPTTFWDIFRPSPIIINNPPAASQPLSPAQQGQKDAKFWATVGSAIAVAGAFLVGVVYKQWASQWETTKYTKAIYGDFYKDLGPCELSRRHLANLVNNQLKIDTLKNQKITTYFIAAIGLLVGGLMLAGGGFAVAPALMTAGKIALLFSAIIAAGNCGLHWNDESEIRKHHQNINEQANEVLPQLYNLRNAQSVQGIVLETYVPLYPEPQPYTAV